MLNNYTSKVGEKSTFVIDIIIRNSTILNVGCCVNAIALAVNKHNS
jgi:hypothetical protein